jgi:hypothetical protein
MLVRDGKRNSTMTSAEPRNPLYLLLLLASFVFVLTALAYAVVPTLEEKAMEAGEIPPPSALRDALRKDGWKWLLIEVAAMVALSLASMGLDRLRRLQKERAEAKIGNEQSTTRAP